MNEERENIAMTKNGEKKAKMKMRNKKETEKEQIPDRKENKRMKDNNEKQKKKNERKQWIFSLNIKIINYLQTRFIITEATKAF